MKLTAVLAACSTLALAIPADAAVVTKSFGFTGSNFTLLFGSGSIAPIDPATVTGSVTFDTSLDYTAETAGLTFSSNLPYSAQFGYDSANDSFTLATFAEPTSCSNPANSFCAFFSQFVATADPLPFFFQQSTAVGGFYRAGTITVDGTVPEPATWALLGAGFGAVGAGLRRRRRVGMAYA